MISTTSRSATTSERGLGRASLRLAPAALAVSLLAPSALATVLQTQQEALVEAFGDARVERRVDVLDEAAVRRVRELSGSAPDARMVISYVATKDERVVGTAYFDTHVVRTLPETLMVLVGPSGECVRAEILSFNEPREYLPSERWLGQLHGRALSDELQVKRGIHGITGATLSARAVTQAVRRVLAIHRVLAEACAAKAGAASGQEAPVAPKKPTDEP